MKKYLFCIFILLLSCYSANSKELTQGFIINCDQNYNIFEIYSNNSLDIEKNHDSGHSEKESSKKYVFDTKLYKKKCEIGSHRFTALVEIKQREGYECGVKKNGSITIYLNNKELLQNTTFNDECFDSIDKISFKYNENTLNTEICGHTNKRNNPYWAGCVTYEDGIIEAFKPILHNNINVFKYLLDNNDFSNNLGNALIDGPSFDCNLYPQNKVDEKICFRRILSAYDSLLKNYYDHLIKLLGKEDRIQLDTSQNEWVKRRNECNELYYTKVNKCFEREYILRIEELRINIQEIRNKNKTM